MINDPILAVFGTWTILGFLAFMGSIAFDAIRGRDMPERLINVLLIHILAAASILLIYITLRLFWIAGDS